MSEKNIFLVSYAGKSDPFLPLGSLYVAKSLQKKGFLPRIILSNISEENFCSKLHEYNPLYVGFSVFTCPQIIEMIKLSKLAKREGFTTVWGGHHPTILPEQCISEEYIDFVVCGEGEEISVDFTKNLFEENLEKKLIFKAPKIIRNLDNVEPALDLVNLEDYVSEILNHLIKKYGPLKSMGYLLTSRGCLSNCGFCGIHGLYNEAGKSVRNVHSPDSVHKQISYIKSKIPDLERIIVWDDSFFVGNKIDGRSKKIIEILNEEKLKFTLEVRGTFLKDTEKIKMLKDMGCLQVFIGAESGSQNILNLMKKGIRVGDYVTAVENCLKEDLPIRLSFFYGYPGETLESINETKKILRLLKSYGEGVTVSGPKMYRPVPGTEGFREAIKLGFKNPEKTEDWVKVNSNTDPTLLPWLIDEAKRWGVRSDNIFEWLEIRSNE